jgi:serine/threonine protein kinase
MTGVPVMNFYDPSKKKLDMKFIDGMLYLPKLEKMTLECVDFIARCLQFEPKKRLTMSEVNMHPFLATPL